MIFNLLKILHLLVCLNLVQNTNIFIFFGFKSRFQQKLNNDFHFTQDSASFGVFASSTETVKTLIFLYFFDLKQDLNKN